MDYLNSLQCKNDPFASPPGTEIFLTQSIRDAIGKLSHNIFLGAGLQLIVGPYGSGKSTILNQLSQKFSADSKTVVLLLPSPHFSSLQQFLITVTGVFKAIKPPQDVDDNTFQQAFIAFFIKLCQQEKKTVLLLIDNGQILPDFCLQAINSFYGHHPDCRRFLQTVICGDSTIQNKINADKAISSRVVFTATLKPFSFKETRELISFHLKQAAADPDSPPALFSFPAQWAIYHLSQGHPKKIIGLCRYIFLTLVIENRKKADWFMTLRCAKLLIPKRAKRLQRIRVLSLSSLIVLMLVFGLATEQFKKLGPPLLTGLPKINVAQKVQPSKQQPVETVKVTQKAAPPEQTKEKAPAAPQIIKEVKPIISAQEQVSVAEPAEKHAALPDQPEDKPEIPEAPAPESVSVEAAPAMPEPKPVPHVETIVTPAIRERREVRPGDTFLGMIQQIYGPAYLKPNYIHQVIAANPHLRDPDNLEVGEQVFFPVLVSGEAKTIETAAPSESLAAAEVPREKQPNDLPERTGKRFEPPEILGTIITANGETFGDMVRRIYGPWSFNEENIKKVMAVNQSLKSPELLFVGFKIRFPAIPVALTPKAVETWWVRITTLDTLQSAYRFLRNNRKTLPPLLIIPSRGDSGKIIMNILLEEYFMDEDSALKAINALPSTAEDLVEALHGLDPATFYYRMK